jgi:hypothetical protein
MSVKGNGYDNAYEECFFYSLEIECVHCERIVSCFLTREKTDYNRRQHYSTMENIA